MCSSGGFVPCFGVHFARAQHRAQNCFENSFWLHTTCACDAYVVMSFGGLARGGGVGVEAMRAPHNPTYTVQITTEHGCTHSTRGRNELAINIPGSQQAPNKAAPRYEWQQVQLVGHIHCISKLDTLPQNLWIDTAHTFPRGTSSRQSAPHTHLAMLQRQVVAPATNGSAFKQGALPARPLSASRSICSRSAGSRSNHSSGSNARRAQQTIVCSLVKRAEDVHAGAERLGACSVVRRGALFRRGGPPLLRRPRVPTTNAQHDGLVTQTVSFPTLQ